MENHILEVVIENSNIHIQNSYIITDEKEMFKMLLKIRNDAIFYRNIKYTRTMKSWIREWKAHNLLYRFGYEKKRTGSVDLDENESTFRLLGYFVLSYLYDIFS